MYYSTVRYLFCYRHKHSECKNNMDLVYFSDAPKLGLSRCYNIQSQYIKYIIKHAFDVL